MKIGFDVRFSQKDIEHFKLCRVPLEEAAKIKLKEKILEEIDSYISFEKSEFMGEVEFSGEFFILHKSQVEHIFEVLSIGATKQTKSLVMREINQM